MKIIFGVVSADEFDNVGKIRKHNFFSLKRLGHLSPERLGEN